MDPLLNPFSPGAGSPPPELVGRDAVLDQAALALARIKAGRSEKSLLMVGLRGVGKTVLLNEIERRAAKAGYGTVSAEARDDQALPSLLIPHLRQLVLSLDVSERVSAKVKRALRVMRSFVGGLKAKLGEIELGLDIDPEKGAADSGDLAVDLTALFVALGEAAADRGTAVAIIIDELQYVAEEELGALIMAMHKIAQRQLPVVLIGAGLPQLVGNAGRSKSYAERLFLFPEIGPLADAVARKAVGDPARRAGVKFADDALAEVARATGGYPYFLQEWGYCVWNLAPSSSITIGVVRDAASEATARLDANFFRVRFDRLTPREKEYLRAIAELGNAPQRTGDIARLLGTESHRVATLRDGLLRKGMIYSPQHGETAFTVPLFSEFMKRVMPDFGAARRGRRK